MQHTVQIDKILAAIGQAPAEAKRQLRKLYAALAEVDGMMIGAGKNGRDSHSYGCFVHF